MSLPDLPSGVYRHYKGPLYFVFGYGHDANAEDLWRQVEDDPEAMVCLSERAVVVYMALELTDAHTGPRLAVRTAEDFHAPVCWESRCPDYGGPHQRGSYSHTCAPRFAYVGPTWEG